MKQLTLFNLEQVPKRKGRMSASLAIPEDIIVAAIELMGAIDLDPYCLDKTLPAVPAKLYFGTEENGLKKPWGPKRRIFLSPPTTRATSAWINKLCNEYEQGGITQAVVYVKAAVDSDWWKRLIAYPVCFVERRLNAKKHGTAHANAVVYLGPNLDGFADAFGLVGAVYVPFQQGLFRRIAPKRVPAQDGQAQAVQNQTEHRTPQPLQPVAEQYAQSGPQPALLQTEARQNKLKKVLSGPQVIRHGHYILTVLYSACYLTITNPGWDPEIETQDQDWLLDSIMSIPGILPSKHGHVSKTHEGTVKLIFSFEKDQAEGVISNIEALLDAPQDRPIRKAKPIQRPSRPSHHQNRQSGR